MLIKPPVTTVYEADQKWNRTTNVLSQMVSDVVQNQSGSECHFSTYWGVGRQPAAPIPHGTRIIVVRRDSTTGQEKPIFWGWVTSSNYNCPSIGVSYTASSWLALISNKTISDLAMPTGVPYWLPPGSGVNIYSTPFTSLGKYFDPIAILDYLFFLTDARLNGTLTPKPVEIKRVFEAEALRLPKAKVYLPVHDIDSDTIKVVTKEETRSFVQTDNIEEMTISSLLDILLYTYGIRLLDSFTADGKPAVIASRIAERSIEVSVGHDVTKTAAEQQAFAKSITIVSASQAYDAIEISCPIYALATFCSQMAVENDGILPIPLEVGQGEDKKRTFDINWVLPGAPNETLVIPWLGLVPMWPLAKGIVDENSVPLEKLSEFPYSFLYDVMSGYNMFEFNIGYESDPQWATPAMEAYLGRSLDDALIVNRLFRLPRWIYDLGTVANVEPMSGVSLQPMAFMLVETLGVSSGNLVSRVAWAPVDNARFETIQTPYGDRTFVDLQTSAGFMKFGDKNILRPVAVTVPIKMKAMRYVKRIQLTSKSPTDPSYHALTIKRDDWPVVMTLDTVLRSFLSPGDGSFSFFENAYNMTFDVLLISGTLNTMTGVPIMAQGRLNVNAFTESILEVMSLCFARYNVGATIIPVEAEVESNIGMASMKGISVVVYGDLGSIVSNVLPLTNGLKTDQPFVVNSLPAYPSQRMFSGVISDYDEAITALYNAILRYVPATPYNIQGARYAFIRDDIAPGDVISVTEDRGITIPNCYVLRLTKDFANETMTIDASNILLKDNDFTALFSHPVTRRRHNEAKIRI